MSGMLAIIPPEIVSKEIIFHFNTQAVYSFSRASKLALALLGLAATFPQKDIELAGNRVITAPNLNKEDRTIKALLQQKLKIEILDLHPYFPLHVEIAMHSAKSDSLVNLINYARCQNNSDATMLSLAFYDFKTKKMQSCDLEKALKLAIQFPDNTRFIQAIFSHQNAEGISSAVLGIVLLEVIKGDHPGLVKTVLSLPNAPTIAPAILNRAILTTENAECIRWILLHSKTIWITGKTLSDALITSVKANHPEAIQNILCHPNAFDISSNTLKQAIAIARKKAHLEALQTLLSLIERTD